MKQIDYIKIKVENTETINTQFLVPHPTVKNRYHINFPENGFNGLTLFGTNIEVYHHNTNLYVKCSLPYLKHGHNYCYLDIRQAQDLFIYLSDLLNVDLFKGIVIDYEIGYIFHPEVDFSYIQQHINGVRGMRLLKKDQWISVYGRKNTQLKIYHIGKNFGRKVPKSIVDTIDFQQGTPVKVELKIAKDKTYTLDDFLLYGYTAKEAKLDRLIDEKVDVSGVLNYKGKKFDDVLYLTLHRIASHGIDDLILEVIDSMDLTHPQKTARRNALKAKRQLKKDTTKLSFRGLLENEPIGEPYWRTYRDDVIGNENSTNNCGEDLPF